MTAVRSLLPILLLMICVSVRGAPVPPGGQDEIAWQAWSPAAFEQARVEKKPVFLYLEAVWCHWCHVMQRETLSRRDVREQERRRSSQLQQRVGGGKFPENFPDEVQLCGQEHGTNGRGRGCVLSGVNLEM